MIGGNLKIWSVILNCDRQYFKITSEVFLFKLCKVILKYLGGNYKIHGMLI